MNLESSGCTFFNCIHSFYVVISCLSCQFNYFRLWFSVCCWFYPFWFFEFSVVIRFIVDDSIVWSLRFSCVLPPINNVPEVFICILPPIIQRPRGFLDSSFIVILVGYVIRTHRKTNALQFHSDFFFTTLQLVYFVRGFCFVLTLFCRCRSSLAHKLFCVLDCEWMII